MKKLLIYFVLLLIAIPLYAQNETQVLFEAGKEGYKSYRIPAIVKLKNGDLVAFAEGRVDGAADFGNVKIVNRISHDNGKTWSEMNIVASNGNMQASNSAPIVDFHDPEYPDGRLFLFYNTGNKHEYEVRQGLGERRVWYKTSVDNGKTWSEAVEITPQVKKEDWRTYANTPGHAMQFQSGKYKGRIYIAANHSVGDPVSDFSDYWAHGYFTDDHGKTFKLSERVDFPSSNESTAAPLPDGRLIMNSRIQSGNPKFRLVSFSNDGGETWQETYVDENLPDPVNQGAILNLGEGTDSNILAFSNAADPEHRRNLTLRISEDGGRTWINSILVDEEGESTMYSDIVKISENEIGVLYERRDYSQIVFKVIKWR